ncbi:UNKNOWN [Stylonychia lemnae]|uniref:Transmembrane protein n=1 Tax=Stylonychia lemnae TaxID=5949 RepID=A0A078A280_STYLE|nr:UNKNOWN [Stylonychia lemnae]|eukprot:CDW74869.1 UNKNOWN [Stylonychia lemnae]
MSDSNPYLQHGVKSGLLNPDPQKSCHQQNHAQDETSSTIQNDWQQTNLINQDANQHQNNSKKLAKQYKVTLTKSSKVQNEAKINEIIQPPSLEFANQRIKRLVTCHNVISYILVSLNGIASLHSLYFLFARDAFHHFKIEDRAGNILKANFEDSLLLYLGLFKLLLHLILLKWSVLGFKFFNPLTKDVEDQELSAINPIQSNDQGKKKKKQKLSSSLKYYRKRTMKTMFFAVFVLFVLVVVARQHILDTAYQAIQNYYMNQTSSTTSSTSKLVKASHQEFFDQGEYHPYHNDENEDFIENNNQFLNHQDDKFNDVERVNEVTKQLIQQYSDYIQKGQSLADLPFQNQLTNASQPLDQYQQMIVDSCMKIMPDFSVVICDQISRRFYDQYNTTHTQIRISESRRLAIAQNDDSENPNDWHHRGGHPHKFILPFNLNEIAQDEVKDRANKKISRMGMKFLLISTSVIAVVAGIILLITNKAMKYQKIRERYQQVKGRNPHQQLVISHQEF